MRLKTEAEEDEVDDDEGKGGGNHLAVKGWGGEKELR